MQTGWFRRVQVKSENSHRIRALLNARSLLVQMRRALENQIRGLFKSFGLIIGRANGGVFVKRVLDVSQQAPELAGIAGPFLAARADIDCQRLDLERRIKRLARENAQSCVFMTVPGIGPMTALAFLSGIDDRAVSHDREPSVPIWASRQDAMHPARWIGPGAYPNTETLCCGPICLKRPMWC